MRASSPPPPANLAAERYRQASDLTHEPASRETLAKNAADPRPDADRGGGPSAWVSPVDRIDLSRLTAAPPLHRPTVTGAGAEPSGRHVGGGMRPPADHTVALSDGTRISFGSVEEVPVLEYT